eukprot:TRINITY_DN23787_c0_g1_i3.p2 TRINITY_DN23787_c0_g1~~TRINITY_DN23787_c0_g1_i3.p2  ORF type:complete len:118 (+),score=20.53 TRINITY_DN23787_c0_g1_i3:41-394(+)
MFENNNRPIILNNSRSNLSKNRIKSRIIIAILHGENVLSRNNKRPAFNNSTNRSNCNIIIIRRKRFINIMLIDFIKNLTKITTFRTVSYTHLTLPTILLVQISVVAVSLKKKKKQKW